MAGQGNDLKVNDAGLVCGGVHTANATVYMIDTVLVPPSQVAVIVRREIRQSGSPGCLIAC